MKRFFYLLIVAMTLSGPTASAVVLDFEGFAAGTIIDDEYNGLGVSISATNFSYGPDVAVVFDSDNPTGDDGDLGAPFDNPDLGRLTPGNLLILQERNNCDASTCSIPDDEGSRPAGQFVISFTEGVLLRSIDFFDVEGVEASPNHAIELYDVDNNLITGAFFVPATGGDNMWAPLFFGVDGVHTVVINMGGSGAIDNIDFETRVVPVPPALPLFITALASMVMMRRRA